MRRTRLAVATTFLVSVVLVGCRAFLGAPWAAAGQIDDEAVLAVVVDSLPFAMALTSDVPYTVLLDSRVSWWGGDQGLDRAHSESWMAQQMAKPYIVGICSSALDVDTCNDGLATTGARMVASLSWPHQPLWPGNGLSVLVTFSRGPFATGVELLLTDVRGAWSVTGLGMRFIT